MESQMVQNSGGKIVFTFNKFFIKVKTDFHFPSFQESFHINPIFSS